MKPGVTQSPACGYRYLFGPVASRRFGRSLGIDMLPPKICSFNCVFCEVGATPRTTLVRREYVPLSDVVCEFDQWLSSGGSADYVTLAGSGEPTLHTGFGAMLAHVCEVSTCKTALLTNSTLLHLPEVRAGAARATVVKASLSVWNDALLQTVNRPCQGVTLRRIVDGLRRFRDEYSGALWLEVFVLAGVNDSDEDMARIAEIAGSIRPDRIQLNTVVRPPADAAAEPLSRERLETLATVFGGSAEVIAGFESSTAETDAMTTERIVSILERRPSTVPDLAAAFAMDADEVQGRLDAMVQSGCIGRIEQSGKIYYAVGRRMK